jgi:exodeoxyribonuclease-3
MRVLSWNVNGLRAAAKKGFLDWLGSARGQVVSLQETRALPEQLEDHVRKPARWHTHFHAAERKGYSGVATFSRKRPDYVQTSLGADEFDREGRFLRTDIGSLVVVNGYFPNGNGKDRDNSRIPYKLEFTRKVRELLQPEVEKGRPILVMGDFNTAHTDIDLARPRQNRNKTSGFFDEECAELDNWVNAGWVDTFRHFEQGEGHYTWWSQRFGVREKNIGWRIDYIYASPGAMKFLKRGYILKDVQGSDHCPIGVDLDNAVLDANWR